MANTYIALATVTVGSGGAANIEFTSIPQTYTDLVVKVSGRLNAAVDPTTKITFNGSTANYTNRVLYGSGSAVSSFTNTPGYAYGPYWNNSGNTVSTFSNGEFYIPNYTSSNNKSMSLEHISENNGTEAYQFLSSSLWADASAITSITITPINASLVQYSTATLYGIKKN